MKMSCSYLIISSDCMKIGHWLDEKTASIDNGVFVQINKLLACY